MDNKELELKILDYLQNNLSQLEQEKMEHLINISPEYAEEFSEVKQVWESLGNIQTPSPSIEMKSNFHAMLNTFKLEEEQKKSNSIASVFAKIKSLFTYTPAYNWAYALLLICFGGTIGFFVGRKDPQSIANNNKVEQLSTDVKAMKQMMMLALLENPEANQRLKAVSYTNEMNTVDNQVVEALFTTLNSDPNENVRLVTLEALIKLAKNPAVREGLVKSLLLQESPLVQVALADAMVKIQEKGAVKAFKKMLQNEKLNKMVKTKIEKTIKILT